MSLSQRNSMLDAFLTASVGSEAVGIVDIALWSLAEGMDTVWSRYLHGPSDWYKVILSVVGLC